jgi:ATP-dependent Clp protease ATP-binding subunit ClpA
LDVGNIFKPALARGDIRCIGATTLSEFRQSIEKDSALERRFQRIMVEEPSPEETLEMLRQTKQRYETHHRVRLLDAALEAAVTLSVAYVPNRRLPDKACDLVEEACVRALIGTESQWSANEPAQPVEPPNIDAEAVARVVAEWTGIPVARLTEAEQAKLLKLEELLQQRVIGQAEAVASVAQAVRLGRAGLKKSNRPIAVFLFIGPTGVGKTELAKTLANTLFNSERELIRLDMSEFMEAHSVNKLIGAPAGYAGYEEEGQLTGALRRKPYSVVLLDEIEKAHPRIFDLFLQLFDDGRLTDAQGHLADGRNAIFIMTSNVATELIEKRQPLGFKTRLTTSDDIKPKIMAELSQTFRPEFLNRLDEVIVFQHLSAEHIRAIAQLQVTQLSNQLQQQHGMALVVEESALDLICQEGYSEKYGVRPLERAIERLIAKPLSALILEGVRDTITVKGIEGKIIMSPDEDLGLTQ